MKVIAFSVIAIVMQLAGALLYDSFPNPSCDHWTIYCGSTYGATAWALRIMSLGFVGLAVHAKLEGK